MRAAAWCALVLGALPRPGFAGRGDLQAAAQRALGDRPGAAVVLDVQGGKPLAVVNPGLAAEQAFPIGSVFKLVVARAALSDGIADPSEKMDCRNVFQLDGERLRCSTPGGHGKLDIIGAIAHSCNVHFYHLAVRMGPGPILREARLLGLGSATGLYEGGEAAGSVPPEVPPNEVPLLGIGDVPSLTVTVLQMAKLAAELAKERGTAVGGILHRAMVLGVAEGTAQAAAVEGLTVAGKTGSPSQPWGQGTYAWFVGYAPAEDPRVAVAVLVLEGHGRDTAAPVAGKILSAWWKTAPDHPGA